MQWVVFACAALGFAVSAYVFYVKGWDRKLVCMLQDNNCDAVVKSNYGYLFFGIPNEFFGLLYYLAVLAAISVGMASHPVILAASVVAVAFSLYLAGVQAFILNAWCEFCLSTAVLNGVILFFLLRMG